MILDIFFFFFHRTLLFSSSFLLLFVTFNSLSRISRNMFSTNNSSETTHEERKKREQRMCLERVWEWAARNMNGSNACLIIVKKSAGPLVWKVDGTTRSRKKRMRTLLLLVFYSFFIFLHTYPIQCMFARFFFFFTPFTVVWIHHTPRFWCLLCLLQGEVEELTFCSFVLFAYAASALFFNTFFTLWIDAKMHCFFETSTTSMQII